MSDFKELMEVALYRLGAESDGSGTFTLMTMAGPLYCRPEEQALRTQFQRVDFASGVVQGENFNHASGRWDFVFEKAARDQVRSVFIDLAGILPALPQYGDFPGAADAGILPVSTILSYFYRDHSNSKVGASVVFAPERAPRLYLAQALTRACCLHLGTACFVPGQVGLKDLQGSFLGCEHIWDPAIDHAFHEISGLSWSRVATPSDRRTFSEFVDNCIELALARVGWDESYRPPFYEELRANFEARRQRDIEGPSSV